MCDRLLLTMDKRKKTCAPCRKRQAIGRRNILSPRNPRHKVGRVDLVPRVTDKRVCQFMLGVEVTL